MASIKKITPDLLQVGMYITGMEGGSNDESARLRNEGLLTRVQTVEKLKQMDVRTVYIDVEKGIDCIGSVDDVQISPTKIELPQPSLDDLPPPKSLDTDDIGKTLVSFEQEMGDAVELHSKALSLVDDVMHDVKMGRALDLTTVDDIASEITASLVNNQNALASLMRKRSMDAYLLEHSMNVSVLMGIMVRSLGYREDIVKELVLGAFLHDIGKVRVPDEILHKPGKLTNEEWDEMKRHVDYGIEALEEVDGISPLAKSICAQHHEKLDGTGYPYGLDHTQLPRHTRIASVVDVYDAVTADRCYHKGMEPTVALKKMLTWTGDHLDKDMVYQLIRCLGVYPPGSFVELESGHIAMVQEHHPAKPNRPVVQMVYDPKRQKALDGFVVDLRKYDTYGVAIKAANPEQYGLNISDFLKD
ncbi:MAG: HD-GYP domain-containing protein [Candidatus Pelagadaptatus aseana]|uniref:HD-GYP domain-containing protein n=1 Tax=Candidatus Pelagadaptatus aseana TaxID=3120508 RepID=UPI0039B1577F